MAQEGGSDRYNAVKFGETSNYAMFQHDGELNFSGTARINRHYYIENFRFKKPAANYPDDGWEDIYPTLDFDKNTEQSAYFIMNLPYRWDSSTDITVVALWMYDTNAADAAKSVCWGVEYNSKAIGEAITGSTVTITQAQAAINTNEGKLISTEFTTKILASNLATHDQLAIRFYRDVANDDYGHDARFLGLHIEFVMNKLGQAT